VVRAACLPGRAVACLARSKVLLRVPDRLKLGAGIHRDGRRMGTAFGTHSVFARPTVGGGPAVTASGGYYEVLGVTSDADTKAIKNAFRQLARCDHPDTSTGPDAERRFKEIAEASLLVWPLASVTGGTGGLGYLHLPGLVSAMHWQLILKAGNANDLHESWRRRHQVQGGPGPPGVPAHPRERSQATGVAKAQAGHVQQDLSALSVDGVAHVLVGLVRRRDVELAGEHDRGLSGLADEAAHGEHVREPDGT